MEIKSDSKAILYAPLSQFEEIMKAKLKPVLSISRRNLIQVLISSMNDIST